VGEGDILAYKPKVGQFNYLNADTESRIKCLPDNLENTFFLAMF